MTFVLLVLAVSIPISALVCALIVYGIHGFISGQDSGELTKDEWEHFKDRYSTYKDELVQEAKAAADIAAVALRSSIVLNGASAAATLAFIGRIWASSSSSIVISELTDVLSTFLVATLLAAVSTVFAYGRMYFGTVNWDTWKRDQDDNKFAFQAANFCQLIAVFLVLQSYVLFTAGVVLAVDIIKASATVTNLLLRL
ncbi:hypothetical protein [Thalassospira povalilytica]|uniref:hypothetical protein n=1 Tax=Thalassospira povalilytica TaxID=732237 RepID=UPI003AA8369C